MVAILIDHLCRDVGPEIVGEIGIEGPQTLDDLQGALHIGEIPVVIARRVGVVEAAEVGIVKTRPPANDLFRVVELLVEALDRLADGGVGDDVEALRELAFDALVPLPLFPLGFLFRRAALFLFVRGDREVGDVAGARRDRKHVGGEIVFGEVFHPDVGGEGMVPDDRHAVLVKEDRVRRLVALLLGEQGFGARRDLAAGVAENDLDGILFGRHVRRHTRRLAEFGAERSADDHHGLARGRYHRSGRDHNGNDPVSVDRYLGSERDRRRRLRLGVGRDADGPAASGERQDHGAQEQNGENSLHGRLSSLRVSGAVSFRPRRITVFALSWFSRREPKRNGNGTRRMVITVSSYIISSFFARFNIPNCRIVALH